MGAFVRGGMATESYAAAQAAAAISQAFGAGQYLVDVKAQRGFGVVYTNGTSKPMLVFIVYFSSGATANSMRLLVNGVIVTGATALASGGSYGTLSAVVAPGQSYQCEYASGSGSTLESWKEY